MSYKLDAGSSNSYSFTGPNVHSTSIYLGKHWNAPWSTVPLLLPLFGSVPTDLA